MGAITHQAACVPATKMAHNAIIFLAVSMLIVSAHSQISSLKEVCRGRGKINLSAASCNQYIACDNNNGTLRTCAAGQNWNSVNKKCDNSACSGKRGYWKQTMKTGGLIAVHCTLIPKTGMVAIWHRGVSWWNGNTPQPGMAQPGNPKNEMLSAVLDPALNRYKGYDVGPPFCSGHVPLEDGSVLSCGGEFKNMNRRSNDPEDGIYKCRILKCSKNAVDSCSWKTIGDMGASRWYPGMIMFPAYTSNKGSFAIVTGGSKIAQDPKKSSDVPTSIDWVWPFAKDGKKFATTDPTPFTLKMKERNLYPLLWLMPFRNNGKYVMFQFAVNSGELVTVSDPATTKQPISLYKPIPSIPVTGGFTYPTGACAALHALQPPYTNAFVTVFGGHSGTFNSFADLANINAGNTGLKSSFTINLAASNPSWQEEQMPDNAIMRTCITLPNGKILLIHGVRKGRMTSTTEGKGCGKDKINNAWIFDPRAPRGQRFTVDKAVEQTYRAYHSCGLVMPDGSLFAAGGDTDPVPANTNQCVGPLKLHYNVDGYVPPNIFEAIATKQRPFIKTFPSTLGYGQTYSITYSGTVTDCVLMTSPSNTHDIEQSGRVVFLETTSNDRTAKIIRVKTPSDPVVILRGWHLLFCVNNYDTYSKGQWVNLK